MMTLIKPRPSPHALLTARTSEQFIPGYTDLTDFRQCPPDVTNRTPAPSVTADSPTSDHDQLSGADEFAHSSGVRKDERAISSGFRVMNSRIHILDAG
jgi:hypothetical protein